ncbi:lipid II flippase MurJ [Hansschlegelia beijingensis]
MGLPAVVALRCVTPGFHASGDTATPVKALAAATIVNVALKVLLVGSFFSAGLAFATSMGAWVDVLVFALVVKDG